MAKRDHPVDVVVDELASLTGRSTAEVKLAVGVVVGGLALAALLRGLSYVANLGPRPGRGPAYLVPRPRSG